MGGTVLFLDWRYDERPIWRVAIHFRRPDGDLDGHVPGEAAARLVADLGASGLARTPWVAIDGDRWGYEVGFRVHAADRAEALADAEALVRFCAADAGLPATWHVGRATSTRSGLTAA
jgi:hypothetical protein